MKYRFFCYVCKRHVSFDDESEKYARLRFQASGHSSDRVPALAPNLGRTSRRYQREIARHCPGGPEEIAA